MSTIDPGVEEAIEDGANDIEDKANSPEGDWVNQEEEDFRQPSQWWFASTACPLLAGTFGPMASGFNILALVQFWRQTIPPGVNAIEEEGHTIPDPGWLIAINTLSLAAAIVGNASLLLNMARRVKFSIAQPITIGGFSLAGLLLIADLAALASLPDYGIKIPALIPGHRHALTEAFYYAIFAAGIYCIIGMLMGLTVYGAIVGHYPKDFNLTSSQRTLMLQTMSFIAYLLLGALVYSHIEGWPYLDSVYWADVTLLTVGLGDYSPQTNTGKGLLFPFAIGGILIVGLVVGSIRTLILERGKEKMSARIVEKRRSKAVHNVDDRKQTIKISIWAKADFSTDSRLSPAQRREEEFNVMRKVQKAAEDERRWVGLATSASFALLLWFVGAVVFMEAEYRNHWGYFDSLYFSYTSLLTIGYGDYTPQSNSGKAFFVLWSLLAVPSLTILISNMGDTVVKMFSDFTIWIGSLTVLPDEAGFRVSMKKAAETLMQRIDDSLKSFSGPGIFGASPVKHDLRKERTEYENEMLDRLAERLVTHIDEDEIRKGEDGNQSAHDQESDTQFYHYVLARECRNVQKDINTHPPKKYSWGDWEYFLKLMGNEDDPEDFPGQEHPDIMVPDALRAPKGLVHSDLKTGPGQEATGKGQPKPTTDGAADQETDGSKGSSSDDQASPMDGNVDRKQSLAEQAAARKKGLRRRRRPNPDAEPDYLLDWSWLSNESPLMSTKTEAEWVLERLSAALERELNRQRKGYKRRPPISLQDASRAKSGGTKDASQSAEGEASYKAQQGLAKAAKEE